MKDVTDLLEATDIIAAAPDSERAAEVEPKIQSESAGDSADELDELMAYRHVPFPVVGSRLVQYRYLGPLKPRSFDLPEDDE